MLRLGERRFSSKRNSQSKLLLRISFMFKLCLFLNYFLSVEDKEALGRLVDTTAHEVEHHVSLVAVGSELADACGLTIEIEACHHDLSS